MHSDKAHDILDAYLHVQDGLRGNAILRARNW
jgi:hypothetical protein